MNKDKVAAMEDIYRRLPKIECKGLCHESCGPIGFTQIEGKRIEKKLHRLPTVVCGEKGLPSFQVGSCSLLVNQRCQAYELRPLICRLWGVVESMKCPHGCRPSRMLTAEEGFAFVHAALKISPMTDVSHEAVETVARLVTSAGDILG